MNTLWNSENIDQVQAQIVTTITRHWRLCLTNCENISNIREDNLLNCWGRIGSPVHCLSAGRRFAEAVFVVSRFDSVGAKECKSDRSRQELFHVPSSQSPFRARSLFKRVLTCKNRRRYSRERASQKIGGDSIILFIRLLTREPRGTESNR